MSDYLEIEAEESEYLYKDTSQIPNSGFGLFSAIDIIKGEIISVFEGEILTDNEAEKRVNQGIDQYFINLLDGTIMDSKNIDCYAKLANDAEGFGKSGFKNNAEIALDNEDNPCIVATKNIKSGDELFCGYGKKYWEKHGQN